jgi:hypothetical protein
MTSSFISNQVIVDIGAVEIILFDICERVIFIARFITILSSFKWVDEKMEWSTASYSLKLKERKVLTHDLLEIIVFS